MATGETLDVEEWMTRAEAPRILDFWEAMQTVVAIPDPTRDTAQVCHMLSRVAAAIGASNGIEYPIDSPHDFMPPTWKPFKAREKAKTKEQIADELDSGLGVKR